MSVRKASDSEWHKEPYCIKVAYSNSPCDKYGAADNKYARGISATKNEIEEEINMTKKKFKNLVSQVDLLLGTRDLGEETKKEWLSNIVNTCLRDAREWMASLGAALASVDNPDIVQVGKYEELNRLYDTIMVELDDPRHLPLYDSRSKFSLLNECRRWNLVENGYSRVSSIQVPEKGPFSLANFLQRQGIINSTREAKALALVNSNIGADVYIKRNEV